MKIVITGGGTGGHIFPALAVAEELRDRGHRVTWIGTKEGMEAKIVPQAGFDFHAVMAGKLRRYWDWQNLTDIFKIFWGFLQARSFLLSIKPEVVFSKGGFVSVPVALAARLLGIPVVTHESDASPGLATKLIVRFGSAKICAGFKAIKKYFPDKKVIITGTPVREYFFSENTSIRKELGIPEGDRLVVVFGGSQGALGLNKLIWGGLDQILQLSWVIHQSGKVSLAEAEKVKMGLNKTIRDKYIIKDTFDNEKMADVLKAADLVVARAGATSLAELAAVGAAAILVPLPTSGSRGDQLDNAEFLRENDAAVICRQEETSVQEMTQEMISLLKDNKRRKELSTNISKLANKTAAEKLANVIEVTPV